MDIKNKQIAVLAPVAWRTPPRAYGAWETVASNITEGLVARGWDVTLFATGDSLTSADLQSVVDRGYEEDAAVETPSEAGKSTVRRRKRTQKAAAAGPDGDSG